MPNLQRLHLHMVDAHLARRGITNAAVLNAFRGVAREDFVPEELTPFAYEDAPLPIGEGQTISQPYVVALTIQELGLRGGERVLEVGTGSGYAAAILSRIASEVYTIERVPSLAESAEERLARLGFANVHVTCGDGSLGWPEHAPYDAIAVAAGGPKPPPALLSQLALGGSLVIPVGDSESSQVLVRIVREGETQFRREPLTDVRFVPLIGEQGWGGDHAKVVRPLRRMRVPAGIGSIVREAARPIDAQPGSAPPTEQSQRDRSSAGPYFRSTFPR
jgi:protein-L-isoaspartate(D-aspartate) O-methyltransferase